MVIKIFGRHLGLPIALILFLAAAANAQQKRLTLDDIYDPDTRVDFSGHPPSGIVWIDQAHYVWPRESAGSRSVDWMKVDSATGSTEPLFDAAKMDVALSSLPGVSEDEARRLPHSRHLVFNEKCSAALMTIASDLYLYTLE